jgi:hypothetical protein
MIPMCRFCDTPAVAHYALSKGCACYPDDREQDLCAQHEYKVEPIGTMMLMWEYT